MFLTKSQQGAVDKLFKSYLESNTNNNSISFKAPTGSGKTFMASTFISKVICESFLKNEKIIVIVGTISNAELPMQFAKKIENYKQFHEFNNYEIDYVQSPSNSKSDKAEDFKRLNLRDRKVFVFGTSSFGKNTLFYQNKVLESFLQEAKNFNYKIIFIRDEAHIGGKIDNFGKNNLDNYMNKNADFILKMTATPKDNNLIELTSKEMEEDGVFLLKTEMKKTNLEGEISNEEIIENALETFIKSKKEYETLPNVLIRPALLIQITNDANEIKDPEKHKLFTEGLELLEKKLNKYNLVYLKYLNDKPEVINSKLEPTLEYASRLDSQIDVIIFKIGPATGWDIPRANMLLQLRDVSSESLNMQTLGRIMRNPFPNLEEHHITKKYYVWSNYQKPTREEAFYKLKDKFANDKFFSGRIDKNSASMQENDEAYKNDVKKYLNSDDFKMQVEMINYQNIKYSNDISYSNLASVSQPIPNMIYLKIFNFKKNNEYEKDYKISYFSEFFKKIAINLNKNIEIVKYVFFQNMNQINEYKIKNTTWNTKQDSYTLKDNVKTMKEYAIWMDNNQKPKKIDTSELENYGYFQISAKGNKFIQFLDSKPELKFAEDFLAILTTSELKDEVNFFAKMPTLGSQVYFEYFSKKTGRITKSFMDFALKYKDKIYMFEIKSKNNDYDYEKTKELVNAYKIYMKKFNNKNINLILCYYNEEFNKLEFNTSLNQGEEFLTLPKIIDKIKKNELFY